MSNYPPNGPPPPYGYGHPSGSHPPGSIPGYAYVPAPVMMPMPMYQPHPIPHPQPEPVQQPQPTYVTNYIYQQPPQPDPIRIEEIIDWASVTPATAVTLSHKAFVAGKEGWDDSPLWVIRAQHNGEYVPGKFVLKSRAAYIPHGGKEVPVHNFEVLLAPQHALRWLPSSHGQVPPGAFPAGNTNHGEPLYIARVNHLRSITPGKVHPSHGCCYISYGGSEIAYKQYEVLCKIVG